MGKYTNKLLILFLSITLLILTGSSVLLLKEKWQQPRVNSAPVVTSQKERIITYEGRKGVDALSLLKKQASVRQGESGLVVRIGEYEADSKKREFWAFYVNGKMATVGPAEYVTQPGERIEWKIETY